MTGTRDSESGPRKGFGVWVLLAALTCPCHLPLLAVALSGTAAGAWLGDHTGLAAGLLGALFLIALIGAWHRRGSVLAAPDSGALASRGDRADGGCLNGRDRHTPTDVRRAS